MKSSLLGWEEQIVRKKHWVTAAWMFALVINICLNQAGKSSPNSVSEIGDHNAYICEISHILQWTVWWVLRIYNLCVSFHLLECKLGRLVGDNMVFCNAKMGISVRRCLTDLKMSLRQDILERGSGECDKELIKNRWRWDWLFAPCKFFLYFSLSPVSSLLLEPNISPNQQNISEFAVEHTWLQMYQFLNTTLIYRAAYHYGFFVIIAEIDVIIRDYGNCSCITEINISDYWNLYTSKTCWTYN